MGGRSLVSEGVSVVPRSSVIFLVLKGKQQGAGGFGDLEGITESAGTLEGKE